MSKSIGLKSSCFSFIQSEVNPKSWVTPTRFPVLYVISYTLLFGLLIGSINCPCLLWLGRVIVLVLFYDKYTQLISALKLISMTWTRFWHDLFSLGLQLNNKTTKMLGSHFHYNIAVAIFLLDVNECLSAEPNCTHGKHCINTWGGYQCVCSDGRYGSYCQYGKCIYSTFCT